MVVAVARSDGHFDHLRVVVRCIRRVCCAGGPMALSTMDPLLKREEREVRARRPGEVQGCWSSRRSAGWVYLSTFKLDGPSYYNYDRTHTHIYIYSHIYCIVTYTYSYSHSYS